MKRLATTLLEVFVATIVVLVGYGALRLTLLHGGSAGIQGVFPEFALALGFGVLTPIIGYWILAPIYVAAMWGYVAILRRAGTPFARVSIHIVYFASLITFGFQVLLGTQG